MTFLHFFESPAVCVALFGAIIAYGQYRLNDKNRENQLFDRRYEFYVLAERAWLSTRDDPQGRPFDDIEGIIPIAIKAEMLFGKDIVKHLLSLEGKVHTGSPNFPDDDFAKPFMKYLKLR